MDEALCFRSATDLAAALRRREVSAREVLDAHLAQIARWNPVVNAIVTSTIDHAVERAGTLDDAVARGQEPGPLHGLPIAHKDLVDTAGIRTTYGSPIYADHVPDEDEPFVTRVRDAGAVMVGKTNTPEWGAGSHTFNPVFGTTRNPFDPGRSAGGSSGGAAAALATGMVPIADGSDLGGSLRNPASFCNVIGFRPTLAADADPLDLSVDGPMARSVEDAALLWSVMQPGELVDVRGSARGPRIAWSPTCGGVFPVEPAVSAAVEATRPTFERLGFVTTEAAPDLAGVRDVFLTLRARTYAADLGELLIDHRAELKPTVVWNIEQGFALTGADVARAVEGMRRLRSASGRFFERFDYLVQPVSQVPPFDADLEYPIEVAGEEMETYVDWMASCWSITVLGAPAISVPAGFTGDGLPIGLQIVGAPRDDAGVLRVARAFEEATRFGAIRPPSA
jgi:amidase